MSPLVYTNMRTKCEQTKRSRRSSSLKDIARNQPMRTAAAESMHPKGWWGRTESPRLASAEAKPDTTSGHSRQGSTQLLTISRYIPCCCRIHAPEGAVGATGKPPPRLHRGEPRCSIRTQQAGKHAAPYNQPIYSLPPIYMRSASGMRTRPSACRLFSRKAISIRGGATTVLFRVCAKYLRPSSPLTRICRRRA